MIENGRPSSYLARTMLPSRKRLCHREDVIACDRDLGLFQQTMSQAGRRQEQRLLVGWPAVKQPAQHAKQISAHEAADSKEVGRTGKEIYKSGIDRDREVLVEPWRSRIFNGRMGIRRPKSKEIESGRGRPERPDRSARTGGHSGPRKPPHPTARSTGQADLERVWLLVKTGFRIMAGRGGRPVASASRMSMNGSGLKTFLEGLRAGRLEGCQDERARDREALWEIVRRRIVSGYSSCRWRQHRAGLPDGPGLYVQGRGESVDGTVL